MVGLSLLFFSLPLFFTFRMYEVYLNGDFIYAKTFLKKEIRFHKDELLEIKPLNTINPYFKLISKNGEKYIFAYGKANVLNLFITSRKEVALKIKEDILHYFLN
jgi:hypothetical protein